MGPDAAASLARVSAQASLQRGSGAAEPSAAAGRQPLPQHGSASGAGSHGGGSGSGGGSSNVDAAQLASYSSVAPPKMQVCSTLTIAQDGFWQAAIAHCRSHCARSWRHMQ